mgnify:CR=1 FL=1
MPKRCGRVTPATQIFYNDVEMEASKGWAEQVAELAKLPAPLKHGTTVTDFLANVGNIAGVGTYYYYIKTTDARTRAHRESVSLLSLNINAGPGSCTWYITPGKYTSAIKALLAR